MIKTIYTFFLALLIALFIGLGIDAFYPGPEHLKYPTELSTLSKPGQEETQRQLEIKDEFQEKQDRYQENLKNYNRNVSIISLSVSIIILIVSLTLLSKIEIIANGVLLGGIFIAIYSIIRGFMVDDSIFRFITVSIGLIIALALGYIKFIKPNKKK